MTSDVNSNYTGLAQVQKRHGSCTMYRMAHVKPARRLVD